MPLPRLPEVNPVTNAYQQELEKALLEITESALSEWQSESRSRMDRALDDNLKLLSRLVENAVQEIAQGIAAPGSRSANVGDALDYGDIGRSLGGLAVGLASDLFTRDPKVNVSSNETERSQSLRLSRSQQQAAAIRQVEKGNRNL
tara:strand:+ start:78 stop:515 length:438 start_codon:yes stop_codon:yes gene_type:complete